MSSIAVVDSGPLLAAANRADPDHERCVAALADPTWRLVIPAQCVAEVALLLGRRAGAEAEARFLEGLQGFSVESPRGEEWRRVAELVRRYADLPLGGTDAAVVTLAERYRAEVVITLDRRHFSVVSPRHRPRFRLLPE